MAGGACGGLLQVGYEDGPVFRPLIAPIDSWSVAQVSTPACLEAAVLSGADVELRVGGQPWLMAVGSQIRVTIGNLTIGNLTLLSTAQDAGQDAIGAFNRTTFQWATPDGGAPSTLGQTAGS